eukprot:c17715_g1_i1.p2 GENE.c17715_g1_i1~~c17715_g1_i1.p2  ORF type:complete len:721 (+),score=188.43 c17715_g1_i1:3096-5258(+)
MLCARFVLTHLRANTNIAQRPNLCLVRCLSISRINRGRTSPESKMTTTFLWQPFTSPEAIKNLAQDIIDQGKKVEGLVASVNQDAVTFQNTLGRLAEDEAINLSRSSVISMMSMVHPSKEVRDAANSAKELISAYTVDRAMNRGVYQAVQAFAGTAEASRLQGEAKRLLSQTIRDFERQGLKLSDEKYNQVKESKKRLSELQIKFQANLNEDASFVPLSKEDLDGMPEAFVSGLEKLEDGHFKVTTQYPHYLPVMDHCKVEPTRKKMQKAFDSRCIEQNLPLLEEAIALRHDIAQSLGYNNHAAFVLEVRMARDPEIVLGFLNELATQLTPLALLEREKFLELKQAEVKESFDGLLNAWDFRYYCKRIEETQYQVDGQTISQYFPIQTVTTGVLNVYQHLLGLRFQKVENPLVWYEDVTLWEVHDAASNEFVGHFYMDMHPRDGKYGHACMCPLVPGFDGPDGVHQTPVAAIVCNFTKPTSDRPSLLQFEEVETFFHEFGHVMHELCSKTTFALFHGCNNTETDFVECPSQMLENWCYESEVLELISAHHENPDKKLPQEHCDKLKAAKNANVGVLSKRQLLFGILDMALHTQRNPDTQAIAHSLQRDIQGVEPQEGTNFTASFGHLMGGYDAAYYGYMFSKVFALDLYSKFREQGVLSKELGLRYRESILRPGSSQDGFQMLRTFLGRVPNANAFFEDQGILLDPNEPNKIGALLEHLA